jgi:hypothetical protein
MHITKVLFLAIVVIGSIFLINTCNEDVEIDVNKEYESSKKKAELSNSANNLNIRLDHVDYDCIFKNRNYVRIVCDSMILETAILN